MPNSIIGILGRKSVLCTGYFRGIDVLMCYPGCNQPACASRILRTPTYMPRSEWGERRWSQGLIAGNRR